jgi:hypothetical protein
MLEKAQIVLLFKASLAVDGRLSGVPAAIESLGCRRPIGYLVSKERTTRGNAATEISWLSPLL